jgi:membrane protease YdiL (CAAX protease family)
VFRKHPLVAFFGLAYGISWLAWSPLWLPVFGFELLPILPHHHALGAVGPIAAAFFVSAAQLNGGGPKDLLARMVAWRGRLVWIVVGLIGPLAVFLLASSVAAMFVGGPNPLGGLGRSAEFPRFGAVTFLLYNLLSFGYGEEVGWRGFALPRLQAQRSALGATVLLSIAWALWHIPLFLYRPGYMSMGPTGAAAWFLSLLTGGVLLTWLYNESRGSLLVVALFHAAVDVVFTSDITSDFAVNAAGSIITMWGIAVILITGPRYLSRKGKVVQLDGHSTTTFVERSESSA